MARIVSGTMEPTTPVGCLKSDRLLAEISIRKLTTDNSPDVGSAAGIRIAGGSRGTR